MLGPATLPTSWWNCAAQVSKKRDTFGVAIHEEITGAQKEPADGVRQIRIGLVLQLVLDRFLPFLLSLVTS